MRNLLIVSAVLVVVAIGAFAFLFLNSNDQESQTQETPQSNNSDSSDPENIESDTFEKVTETNDTLTITYADGSFSPSIAQLQSGGTLVWVNSSSSNLEIGVDPHPTHTIDKAITNGEFTLNLGPGEKKSVTVNKAGNFSYHNHLNSNQGGSIEVK